MERNSWGRGGSREPRLREVVPTAVARALGTSRRAAEAALWGPMNLARRCARVITALKVAGDDEALVRFIQPIDLAIHAAQPAALTEEEQLGAPPVSHDEEQSLSARKVAQAYLDRLYEDLAMRAALRSALKATHDPF